MSASPARVHSVIWDHEIAIVGDFAKGSSRLTALLDVIAQSTKKKDLLAAIEETKAFLAKKEHQGKYALLEAGETYDMSGGELVDACESGRKELPTLATKVDAAIAGEQGERIKSLARKWETTLGL